MVSVETASGVQHTFSHPDMHTHYCIDTREVRHSDNCHHYHWPSHYQTSFVNLSCSANIEQGRDASMDWFRVSML